MTCRFLSALLLAVLLPGCASKSYVVLVPSPDGSTGAIVVETPHGVTRVDQKQHAVDLDGRSADVYEVAPQRLHSDFAAALAAQPALPTTYLLYFETGSERLTPQSQVALGEILATVRERGPSAVSVIGHTDTVSGQRWNQQLGLRRARSIARLLEDNGLQAIELVVDSHGEGNLLVKTPDETAEPRNRRVEVTIR